MRGVVNGLELIIARLRVIFAYLRLLVILAGLGALKFNLDPRLFVCCRRLALERIVRHCLGILEVFGGDSSLFWCWHRVFEFVCRSTHFDSMLRVLNRADQK
jgi:hypothetical protein